MKKIICRKPCNIGGTRFSIGESVPEQLIALERETALVKYGLISIEDIPDAAPDAPKVKNDSQTQPSVAADGGKKRNGKKVAD